MTTAPRRYWPDLRVAPMLYADTPAMKDHVYKLIELTGTSTTSIEDAAEKAIKQVGFTVED